MPSDTTLMHACICSSDLHAALLCEIARLTFWICARPPELDIGMLVNVRGAWLWTYIRILGIRLQVISKGDGNAEPLKLEGDQEVGRVAALP